MPKPITKRPAMDNGRADSFSRMLALEKQYRMQRIHNQVSSSSVINTGSLDSSSSESFAIVPLRVRRAANSSAAPLGSSQIPMQNSKHYKDDPLPSLSISIPPPPTKPVAMAVREKAIEAVQVSSEPEDHGRQDVDQEKEEQAKVVTFADEHDDENDLSDQTSICHSPTWDTKKKKKTKPTKSPKTDLRPKGNDADAPGSPKKKGRRLSKQPPTPGPQVQSLTKAERTASAPRFDLGDAETQSTQNKSARSKPPDAMRHPELHQQGHMSDSNEKPRSKGFFSRIRRLSYDDSVKSPKSPVEQAKPPPVQKAHSSGPGTGLGFFSSRKPQNKESTKVSGPRTQSALDSRPPVSSQNSSANRGRSNSLLSATIEMFKGAPKAAVGGSEADRADVHELTKARSPEDGTARNTKFVEGDDILPADIRPPAVNFSKKPRSLSNDSQVSSGSRVAGESIYVGAANPSTDRRVPYESSDSLVHGALPNRSPLRLRQLPASELALLGHDLATLKSARSSEFETASIQESIFNVVKIEERSPDYINFMNESYTPPSLDLLTPVGGRSSPLRSFPSPRQKSEARLTHGSAAAFAKEQEPKEIKDDEQKTPTTETRSKHKPTGTSPLHSSPSLERFGQSWNAGSEAPASGAAELSVPRPASLKGHSRTASERSSSSVYDESAPTPSTPATPDSMIPTRRPDLHPALRDTSSNYPAKADGNSSGGKSERRPRSTFRQSSQETAKVSTGRSVSEEPRTSEDSWNKPPSTLDLDPPPANFFARVDGNGSSSSIASSPTSIKSTSAIKAEMTAATNLDRVQARDMPPRAQSAIDLTSTSFLPPLKHQPLLTKKKTRPAATASPSSPPSESADDESPPVRPKASRNTSAISQESNTALSPGAAYLEEARKAVQPISAARALRGPFAHKNSSSTSVRSAQSVRSEPIAKMLVECCGCKFFHDMPSKVYECMAKPDSIVEDKRLGVSAAVTTMVRCPWCGHGMSTQCCAGYATVLFLKEKLHGK